MTTQTTPTITEFNKAVAEAARVMVKDLLASATSDKFDLKLGNGTFSETELTFKLIVSIKGGKSKDRETLETYCKLFNIDPDVKLVGAKPLGNYTLHTYMPRGTKFQWVVSGEDGNQYKMEHQKILKAVEAAKAAAK
jgi:hypothetical protein